VFAKELQQQLLQQQLQYFYKHTGWQVHKAKINRVKINRIINKTKVSPAFWINECGESGKGGKDGKVYDDTVTKGKVANDSLARSSNQFI
jgi:hypothetical protein